MNFAPERARKRQEKSCAAGWVWGAQEGDWVGLPFPVAELQWQTSMPWVGFEPTIPTSDRTKIIHALDRAATVIGLQIFHEKKLLIQLVITYYRDNTCGTGGATALSSFRNTVNTKTRIAVARKAQQFPPNFNAPDDCQVGRNMYGSHEL
jgi:hypothetical protein